LKSSDEVQASVASTQLSVLSVAPFNVIPPPLAVVSVGVSTSARIMFLSSTTRLVELRFVVVPLTVKLPESVRSVPDTAPVNVAPESAATFAAKARVPVPSGRVIVLSAVGSPAVKVVSNSSAVVPSKIIVCGDGK
jgi:hypothetical protein